MIKGFAGYLVYQSFQSIKSFKSWFRQITNVGFSLRGKAPHCECGEQGSTPGVNRLQKNLTGLMMNKVKNKSRVKPLSSLQMKRKLLVRSSTGQEYRSFKPGVQGSPESPRDCGPTLDE